MIKINTETKEIHAVFGFNSYEDFVDMLSAKTDDSKRVLALTTIFLTLVESGSGKVGGKIGENKNAMIISFMVSVLLEALTKEKLGSPSKVIALLNEELSTDTLYEVYIRIMTARSRLGMNYTLQDLMKGHEDA